MRLRYKDLTQTRQWLTDDEREAVSSVISSSFVNVAPTAYLAKYFDSAEAFERKLRLYFDAERLVGYCLLTFTDEGAATIIRASAGFFPEYRKGGNTFQFSMAQSLKCWLRRPWRQLYYADTMLSPAMYRAIAKNTGIIWPHPAGNGPVDLFERFNHSGDISHIIATRCLVVVGRGSNYSAGELAAFKASDKPEIQYYQLVNPNFNHGVALFVIIPIHLKQFVLTALKQLRAK
ncbi:MAG: hypothetical protein CML20_22005 [Rheinheimera sp.]|uniref:hypothetical protein n=1 Tax=Arsukibacterium sp. UBA3155 TaxID=1946058 RepID=UPI000C8AD242|nr:hypothetical protein [Arsukibacterium sp. UBA3155]MAD77409.1 hypothetical protein [Rheinheimera sp.]|tara:strand:+ start:2816 stop:3514 length:699 start_codon:yes stop_codon:yes gene_type:complete